jgi:hypothetical protein
MRSTEDVQDVGVLFVWDGAPFPVLSTDDLARHHPYLLDLDDPGVRSIDVGLIMKLQPWELALPPGVLGAAEISELGLLPDLRMMTVGNEVVLNSY